MPRVNEYPEDKEHPDLEEGNEEREEVGVEGRGLWLLEQEPHHAVSTLLDRVARLK